MKTKVSCYENSYHVSKVLLFILDMSQNERCYFDDFDYDTYDYTETEGFLCGDDNLCIPNELVCDGQRNCPSGQDEDINECITRNIFPPAATVKCNDTDRPDDLWIEIMAIRCNGQGTIHILHKHILTPYLSALDFCNSLV